MFIAANRSSSKKRKAAQSELNGFFAKAGATEPRNA
jgi:hypothetical protein